MQLNKLNWTLGLSRRFRYVRYYSDVKKDTPTSTEELTSRSTEEDPIRRTVNILKNDIKNTFNRTKQFVQTGKVDVSPPQLTEPVLHCDVLVIGGGAIGSSIAYWLKQKAQKGLNVYVVEKDSTYKEASTPLSVGGIRQQFTIEENVQLSLYAAEFLRTVKKHLGPSVDVQYIPHGYLTLASESGVASLIHNSKMQNELGAKNVVLNATQLKTRFPWLNTDGIEVGCLGLEREGWFDPWSLLQGLKQKSISLGAHYIEGEVIDFLKKQSSPQMAAIEDRNINEAVVRTTNGEIKTVKFAICIIAAGANSGKVARLANIGTGREELAIPLPIEPKKRYVYSFACDDNSCPGLNTPLTIDSTGAYFRRDGLGGNYIGGKSPNADEEPSCDDLEVDYDYFDNTVWPILAHRVPSFEAIKVKSAWAGYYEMNTFDENGVVGGHCYYPNLIFAAGFSGHGIQHSVGVGRAVSELIIEGRYKTIDLTRLGFDRLVIDQPLYEINII